MGTHFIDLGFRVQGKVRGAQRGFRKMTHRSTAPTSAPPISVHVSSAAISVHPATPHPHTLCQPTTNTAKGNSTQCYSECRQCTAKWCRHATPSWP